MTHRILITSDIHNCHCTWYNTPNGERMALYVEAIEAAKARNSYDMTLCLGDVSLDFWKWNEGGSYLWDPPVSRAAEFMETIKPHLPEPFYITPGNHEQYSPEDWQRITGQPREQIVATEYAVFVLLDAFSGNLGPKENSDGTYQPLNCRLIRDALAIGGNTPVFLLSHFVDMEKESEEFKAILRENERIRALFCGHDHGSQIASTGEDAGNKPILHTGHFSYSKHRDPYMAFRGWRELLIGEDGWESFYYVPEQKIPYPGWSLTMEEHVQNEYQGK